MPILFQYRNIRHLLGMYVTKQAEQERGLIALNKLRWFTCLVYFDTILFTCILFTCILLLVSLYLWMTISFLWRFCTSQYLWVCMFWLFCVRIFLFRFNKMLNRQKQQFFSWAGGGVMLRTPKWRAAALIPTMLWGCRHVRARGKTPWWRDVSRLNRRHNNNCT